MGELNETVVITDTTLTLAFWIKLPPSVWSSNRGIPGDQGADLATTLLPYQSKLPIPREIILHSIAPFFLGIAPPGSAQTGPGLNS
jgi:hypothetical protein